MAIFDQNASDYSPEVVNDFTTSAIPKTGVPSLSQAILPGIFEGINTAAYGMGRKAVEQEKKEKEANQAWGEMIMESPDVWDIDYKFIKDKIDEYNEKIKGYKKDGLDPLNLDFDKELELKNLEGEIAKYTKAANENKADWDKVQSDIEIGDWDKGSATTWAQGFLGASDPIARAEYRRGNSPYVKKIAPLDVVSLVKFLGDQVGVTETQGGYVSQRNVEDFKQLASTYFNSPKGSQDREALYKHYNTQDFKSLLDNLEKDFKAMYKKDVTPRPLRTTTSTPKTTQNTGGYGTDNWKGKLTITATPNAPTKFFAGGINEISIGKVDLGGQMPEFTGIIDNKSVDSKGNRLASPVKFQPIIFRMGQDNKVSVWGMEYDQDGNPVIHYNEDGTPMWDGGRFIDYSTNKALFTSNLNGYDVEQDFIERNNPNAAAAGASNVLSMDPNKP